MVKGVCVCVSVCPHRLHQVMSACWFGMALAKLSRLNIDVGP